MGNINKNRENPNKKKQSIGEIQIKKKTGGFLSKFFNLLFRFPEFSQKSRKSAKTYFY
jgi:hypothetical protein